MKEGSVDAGNGKSLKQAKTAGPTIRTLVTTLLLNVSSTTEPVRRRIGSVVELTFNITRVCMVGPAVLACFKLYPFPTSTLPLFALLATLDEWSRVRFLT